MHIREKVKGIDFLLKKVCANRGAISPAKVKSGNIEMKREIRHSFEIPRGSMNKTFSIAVRDMVSFRPGAGPFDIEITVVGFVFLQEEMKGTAIRSLLKDKENINFLINQCLPHSSAAIAYLTDRMGFSPVILAPKFPISRKE